MGLETVVHIADLVKTNPGGTDPKSQGDDHLRNVKTSLLNDFAGFTGAVIVTGVDGGAADAYTLTPANALVAYSSKMLIEFTPIATNLTTTPTLNISALGAKTIKSVSNAALLAGDLVLGTPTVLIYDGTNVRLIGPTKNYVDQLVLSGVLPAQSLGFMRSDGAAAGFTQTHTGYAQNEVKGADIVAASTINLTTATGNFVHVTGSGQNISTITIPLGATRTVIFDGANTLIHSASLLLPGSGPITTDIGARMDVRGDTAGAVVTNFTRASGLPVVSPIIPPATPQSFALLGSATVSSAVANIDFLNIFTSAYDKYTIEIEGLKCSVDGVLTLRAAVAGTADSGLNYSPTLTHTANSTSSLTGAQVSQVILATTGVTNLTIGVLNANSTTAAKTFTCMGNTISDVTPTYTGVAGSAFYLTAANALSGFRLFMTSGNITAGTIRVFGHRNT